MKTKTAPKIITVALLRDLETQVHIKQEISYSRMVEILNEKATQQVTAATEEIKRERDEYYDTLQEYRLKTADMEKRIQELEAHVPKWHNTDIPICYETGPWDGKRSDFVLAYFEGLNPITARVYAGTMDGFEFADWYDADDNSINAKIVKWMYLPNQ